ncbi:uncharacterized protein LOC126678640 [Mercurialis annua]|uniref:uncharacterized protein LOC126678640 n=1 Tax=Mercurialis annua TaxID=3986 RepID=UPI0021601FC6|nr:uncharacterized protein LOC126678640 [Mercurialis annua]
MVSTRSTPTKEKKDFVVPVKMKRKLVKKAEKDVEGSGVASASENVKVKGKKVDETGLKKRRLAFDAVPDHQKVQKSLHIEEPTRLVQNWDYLLDAEDRYTCRVTMPLNFKYIEDIKKTLVSESESYQDKDQKDGNVKAKRYKIRAGKLKL